MATKFGFGYVSKYLVDLWTSPSDRPSPFGTCGQPGQTTSLLPTIRPLAYRVHKGYNNQIIFDTQKIHPPENIPNLPVNLLVFQEVLVIHIKYRPTNFLEEAKNQSSESVRIITMKQQPRIGAVVS